MFCFFFTLVKFQNKSASSAEPSLEYARYAQIVATGGINNQIIAVVNALVIAKSIGQINVLLPSLSTQIGSTYSPISFETYFDPEHFTAVLENLGLTVSRYPPNCDKIVQLPASSGRGFHEILADLKIFLDSNVKLQCLVIKIENQWGVRDWKKNFDGYFEIFESFKVRRELYEVYEKFKHEYLQRPYIALHARVEKSWPTLYFNSQEEEGVRDEVDGIIVHLKKMQIINKIRYIFILSGRDCSDEIFDPLRKMDYTLLCLDSKSVIFNHSGVAGRESYQKAIVDSLIALDADYFIGRYASSASYVLKLKRKSKNVSMYCAMSGFMCSDCGRKCLKHRGVNRHYKSIRDMENCFFIPGCGTDICIDRTSMDGTYDCQKHTMINITFKTSKNCERTHQELIHQEGFKFWLKSCLKGKDTCKEKILTKC